MIPIKVIHNLVTTIDHNNNAPPPIITNILLTVIAPTLKANGGGHGIHECYHGNFLKEYSTKA